MTNEGFNLKKFFDFSPMAFTKIGGLAVKVAIILIVIMGVLNVINIFFPKPSNNINTPAINVAEGGTSNYTVVQHANSKRPWFIPTPFVEVFGEMKTKDQDPQLGARFGARWEF